MAVLSPQKTTTDGKSILIRPLKLRDTITTGRMAACTYFDSQISGYLSPNRLEYADYFIRGFQHRAVTRYFDFRTKTFVAVDAENPDSIVGNIVMARLGDDSRAKAQIKQRRTMGLVVLSWIWWAWLKILLYLDPDRSTDQQAMAKLIKFGEVDGKLHWERDDRRNRWHVQSLVVRNEWQGKGVGKRLMQEVLSRSKAEHIPIGLEASPIGEPVYYKLGFKLLGRFSLLVEDGGGGLMMYDPNASQLETK